MSWEIHDRLAPHMTATTDCERAYRLGVLDALAMRHIAVNDPGAAAAECAGKALGRHPQNPAFKPAPDEAARIMVPDGAHDRADQSVHS